MMSVLGVAETTTIGLLEMKARETWSVQLFNFADVALTIETRHWEKREGKDDLLIVGN